MRGILVRTGVDHSYGGWNGPVDPSSGQFVYVPIPEADHVTFHPQCNRRYAELEPVLHAFADSIDLDLFDDLRCPPQLLQRSMHLDPDYEHLTYGNVGDQRGSHIRALDEGDILVFYAGLRPCTAVRSPLVYAIVGLFVVDEIISAADVPTDQFHENAHIRKKGLQDSVWAELGRGWRSRPPGWNRIAFLKRARLRSPQVRAFTRWTLAFIDSLSALVVWPTIGGLSSSGQSRARAASRPPDSCSVAAPRSGPLVRPDEPASWAAAATALRRRRRPVARRRSEQTRRAMP